jgi:hypothetical protein
VNLTSAPQIAEGVQRFNAVYAEMERALWSLSRAARADVLRRQTSPVVEELIWTIKSWWGVQGVRAETKRLMAQALTAQTWSEEFFQDALDLTPEDESFACDRVSALVSATLQLGAKRHEFSLASKVLHWLMPWKVPVFDSFVRQTAGVKTTLGHLDAYRQIVRWEFDTARQFLLEGTEWIGDVPPASPFRALDKYMWWIGGGDSGRAMVVRDPWRVVRRLGLESA